MAITPRRWRRRIRVTSSRGASGSLIPSDLRIRLPQVERQHLERPVGLLPDEARDGQLDHPRRLWVGLRGRGELYPRSDLLELFAIQDGTVAHEQHLFPGRLQLGGQVAGWGHPILANAHHAPGDPPVERVENLSSAGIDHGPDQPARVADPEGQDVQRGDAQGHRGLGSRGLDAEDDHAALPQGSVSRSRRSHRVAHEGPAPIITIRLASSGPIRVISTSRWSSGSSPSTASPHSTSTTPPSATISSSPRSMTSCTRSKRYTSTW